MNKWVNMGCGGFLKEDWLVTRYPIAILFCHHLTLFFLTSFPITITCSHSTHRIAPLKYSQVINSCLRSVSLPEYKFNDDGVVSALITDESWELGIVLPSIREANSFQWMNEQTGLNPSECSWWSSFPLFLKKFWLIYYHYLLYLRTRLNHPISFLIFNLINSSSLKFPPKTQLLLWTLVSPPWVYCEIQY